MPDQGIAHAGFGVGVDVVASPGPDSSGGVVLHLPPSVVAELRARLAPAPSPAPDGSPDKQPRLFWSLKDLTGPTGLGYMTLNRATASGELPSIRLRDRILVPAAALGVTFTASEPNESSSAASVGGPALMAWSVAETASVFGVSYMTIYRAVDKCEFPTVRIRSRILVPVSAVRALVEAAMTAGQPVDVADWTASWRNNQTASEVAS